MMYSENMIAKNVHLKGIFSRYIHRKCFKSLPFKISIIRIDLVYKISVRKNKIVRKIQNRMQLNDNTNTRITL